MKRIAIACCVLLLGAVGCKKKSSESSTASASSAAASASPAASVANAQIPTEEDYEEEAAQKVTTQNMNDQLDKLDKEINK